MRQVRDSLASEVESTLSATSTVREPPVEIPKQANKHMDPVQAFF